MTFALNSKEALNELKLSLKGAQKAYIDYPNANAWLIQQRASFIYQQAFFFFNSVARTDEQKADLLQAMQSDKDRNWGDLICEAGLNMTLATAMKEYCL